MVKARYLTFSAPQPAGYRTLRLTGRSQAWRTWEPMIRCITAQKAQGERKRAVTERIYLPVKILPLFEVCLFDSKKECLEDIYVAKDQLQHTTAPDSAQSMWTTNARIGSVFLSKESTILQNRISARFYSCLSRKQGVREFLDCTVPSNDRVTTGLGKREQRPEDLNRQR